MILNIIIILIVGYGIYRGIHQGFVNEIINLSGYIVSYIGAMVYSRKIADFLWSFIQSNHDSLNNAPSFFISVCFLIVFTLIWQIFRLIKKLLNPVTKLPVIHITNKFLGAAVGGLVRYLIIFVILQALLIFPIKDFDHQYKESIISQYIIKKTPIISNQIIDNFKVSKNEVNI